MKKVVKIVFRIIGILILLIIAGLAYLNFVYLPQKVKSVTPYLEQKFKGRLKVESSQYIPLKGLQLNNITILSETKKPIFKIAKLYFKLKLWPLLINRNLDFRLELYPEKISRPILLDGIYRLKQHKLDIDFYLTNDLFAQRQTIIGEIQAKIDTQEKSSINLNLISPDLNVRGNFYIQNNDLRIDKLSGKILNSVFDFIGDVQNLTSPTLAIYGDLELDLMGLKKINLKYAPFIEKVNMEGKCLGKIYLAAKLENLEAGLKINAQTLMLGRTNVQDLSITAKMENKKLSLSKFYAKLYDGEVNLDGYCQLDAQDFPANLNVNIFNLEINKIIKDATDKDTSIYGRIFSLAKLNGYLKNPKALTGKLWVSSSGTNILQLPLLMEITDILRLPELRTVEFKEASGNFLIADQKIETRDFKITSNILELNYKGYIDFAGNLAFDIQPNFFQGSLLSMPNIGNILGLLIDSTGNFLGEIKLKGNLKQARHTFKPISPEKLFDKGIKEGLKQLFKIKEE